MNKKLKQFLDAKVNEHNRPSFVKDDPISVPHRFTKKQDIEIAGFFAAIFAWGNRTTIINKANLLMNLMDMSPHDFIKNHQPEDLKKFLGFCHRTFNTTDLLYFIAFLQQHYQHHSSLEKAFISPQKVKEQEPVELALNYFYTYFFSLDEVPQRTRKHIACPANHSTCKRLNMFLRWMIRNDNKGVDFGIWKTLTPAQLICPVDLHVARVAKRFGLLQRKQVDWQAAVELTQNLRKMDPADPVKYDIALFGLGILEKF